MQVRGQCKGKLFCGVVTRNRKELPVVSSGFDFGQGAIPCYARGRCRTTSMGREGALASFRGNVESLIHEGKQFLPTGEIEVAGQGSQIVEEGTSGRQFAAYRLIDETA